MIRAFLEKKLEDKTVVLWGMGREGISTFRFLRKYLPGLPLNCLDEDPSSLQRFRKTFPNEQQVAFYDTMDQILPLKNKNLLVFKSPGISLKHFEDDFWGGELCSQTQLFLELFKKQTIGITGTKGKSTTTSLIFHILKLAGKNTVIGGNMGVPPLDLYEKMLPDTIAVLEMSSHQLETVRLSPHTAVILNLFPEHLDHYKSYQHYQQAKYNIARWQQKGDCLIINNDSELIKAMVSTSTTSAKVFGFQVRSISNDASAFLSKKDVFLRAGEIKMRWTNLADQTPLLGDHNLNNILAAALVCALNNVSEKQIQQGVKTFKGLPHRLQYVGTYKKVECYNDSISTIPESAISALTTLGRVHTLLLGGYDRGIDYLILINFIISYPVSNLIFLGNAGKKMKILWDQAGNKNDKKSYWFDDFRAAVVCAVENTPAGEKLLLSPAAASYDMFENFEERGTKFHEILKSLA